MQTAKAKNKFFNILGICYGAGKMTTGSFAVERSIRKQKANLVIISKEASANTIKKFSNMCKNRNINYIIIGDKLELGRAIGKEEQTILSLMDNNFIRLLLKEIEFLDTGVSSEWLK
ncbi:L7Ae/L30e/S12e/Gadd45 family ribosomal protein [Xylanivirga thermophila]|uniref:L7Ae/L30e/S12e/Gadd45 family ribosomal protein n=1 Tax=Xylanivirga thermophila TaxID=2496273 RepID=UPI00101CF28F|nr:ribosomal L7Ae/L30e/S12e/Gadd45 family protein [Xylanivirga thermophila]